MKPWIRTILVALSAISFFVIVGCTNPVAGKWRGTVWTQSRGPVETFLEFKSGDKVTMTSVTPIVSINDQQVGGNQKIIMEGAYLVLGKRLQCKFATVSGDNNKTTVKMPDNMGELNTAFKQEGDKLFLKLGPNDPETVFTREGKPQ